MSDLLVNNNDPKDNIKRPFTAYIDREIAKERSVSHERSTSRERSLSQGSAGSRSRSPSEGRPRFAYPDKISSLGPLHDPIASSTHKSIDIRAQMTNNGDPESSRLSILSRGQGQAKGHEMGMSPVTKQNSKVVFSEKDEYNDSNEKHSPNSKSSAQLFNDPDYAQFYKKLSPDGRKRELLKQRQGLLDEQERLKHILDKQEQQLKNRQYEYNKRQELQKERLEFYQNGGKFPALQLSFDERENGDDDIADVNRDCGGDILEKGAKLGAMDRGQDGATRKDAGQTGNIQIGINSKMLKSHCSSVFDWMIFCFLC